MFLELFKKTLKNYRFFYRLISLIYYFKWEIRKIFKFKIIDRKRLLKMKNKFSYFEYSEESYATYHEPISVNGNISKQFQNFIGKTYIFPPSFYNIFTNVNLIGPEAVGVLDDKNILVETAGGSLNILNKCSPKLFTQTESISVQKEYDYASVFITPWINNCHKNYFYIKKKTPIFVIFFFKLLFFRYNNFFVIFVAIFNIC